MSNIIQIPKNKEEIQSKAVDWLIMIVVGFFGNVFGNSVTGRSSVYVGGALLTVSEFLLKIEPQYRLAVRSFLLGLMGAIATTNKDTLSGTELGNLSVEDFWSGVKDRFKHTISQYNEQITRPAKNVVKLKPVEKAAEFMGLSGGNNLGQISQIAGEWNPNVEIEDIESYPIEGYPIENYGNTEPSQEIRPKRMA